MMARIIATFSFTFPPSIVETYSIEPAIRVTSSRETGILSASSLCSSNGFISASFHSSNSSIPLRSSYSIPRPTQRISQPASNLVLEPPRSPTCPKPQPDQPAVSSSNESSTRQRTHTRPKSRSHRAAQIRENERHQNRRSNRLHVSPSSICPRDAAGA